ncbi:uncharacterized protein DC041_0001309 [Schistosoma bovis]|uniref:SFR19-like C-terminal domain-containing protein n=1 Tax=Schistosoma bovis TaxID=6184 RepID=A0A430QGV4_SCHBO|nr:uncharacterized protein DC041_0001309 [Schistosoma bovis]
MSRAGLPCNTLSDLNLNNKPNDKPDSVRESSPMKQINKLLSSAASSLLNQLAGSQRTDVDTSSSDPLPPPPPPPLPFQQHNELPPTTSTLSHSFVPPPLPAVINPFSNNEIGDKVLPNGACGETKTECKKPFGDMKIEEVLAKRKRYDFSSRREWQERIALEVKSVLKPAYSLRRINKEDYKEIMKKAVTKCATLILTSPIGSLVSTKLKSQKLLHVLVFTTFEVDSGCSSTLGNKNLSIYVYLPMQRDENPTTTMNSGYWPRLALKSLPPDPISVGFHTRVLDSIPAINSCSLDG